MGKKNRQKSSATTPPARRRRFRLTPSKVFIGIIVLMIAVAAVVSALTSADDPECPRGQVWSDAHDHCH